MPILRFAQAPPEQLNLALHTQKLLETVKTGDIVVEVIKKIFLGLYASS